MWASHFYLIRERTFRTRLYEFIRARYEADHWREAGPPTGPECQAPVPPPFDYAKPFVIGTLKICQGFGYADPLNEPAAIAR